jgi:hypothetical protein
MRWETRVYEWKEATIEKFRSKWWWWPILLVPLVLQHLLLQTICEFLRDIWGSAKWVDVIIAILSANLVVAITVLSVVLILWLALRAFLDARTFTVLDVVFDRSAVPTVTYKLKGRVVLRNNTNRNIEIDQPIWRTGADGVSIQPPFRSRFRIEGAGGWESGDWQQEVQVASVKPGQAFEIWIGLNQSYREHELRRRHEIRRLGVLLLPIKTGRKERKHKIWL